jgi:hypothetical protein
MVIRRSQPFGKQIVTSVEVWFSVRLKDKTPKTLMEKSSLKRSTGTRKSKSYIRHILFSPLLLEKLSIAYLFFRNVYSTSQSAFNFFLFCLPQRILRRREIFGRTSGSCIVTSLSLWHFLSVADASVGKSTVISWLCHVWVTFWKLEISWKWSHFKSLDIQRNTTPVLEILLQNFPCMIEKLSRTALGPTQPPSQLVPGALSLGVKRPGREADHLPHPVPRSTNEWSYTSAPPIRLHGVLLS